MRLGEIYSKRVINLVDGETLGFVKDLHVRMPEGLVEALVIAPPRWNRLVRVMDRHRELIIPWPNVATIGADVILVYYGILIVFVLI